MDATYEYHNRSFLWNCFSIMNEHKIKKLLKLNKKNLKAVQNNQNRKKECKIVYLNSLIFVLFESCIQIVSLSRKLIKR